MPKNALQESGEPDVSDQMSRRLQMRTTSELDADSVSWMRFEPERYAVLLADKVAMIADMVGPLLDGVKVRVARLLPP